MPLVNCCAQPKGRKQTMTADIQYTVKYHPRPVKKVAHVLFLLGGLIIMLLDVILPKVIPGLTPTIFPRTINEVFWGANAIAILCLVIGFVLRSFRWRTGKLELTNEKLMINGSYSISIWPKNMWEVDIREVKFHRWTVRLDSNVDTVQIKFRTDNEFDTFVEKLLQLVEQVENVKIKTTTQISG